MSLQLLRRAGPLIAAIVIGMAPGTLSPVPVLAETPVSTLTLAVIGDYGCQPKSNCTGSPANELAVARLVQSWNPQAIVTVGDNSYEDGSAAVVAADQGPYLADIEAGRFFPTPGNHDWQNGSIAPSTGFFHRPPHYVAHLGGGLVDLFVTDMNYQDADGDSAGSRQAAQYLADVQASTARWKITTDHQAFYSSGEHGTNGYTHWAIVPQIDLFLSGHDHDFEHLQIGGKPFVVNGVGGRNLIRTCVFGCITGSIWHDDRHFGAVRLTITPQTLLVEFISVDGRILHSFQLAKTASGESRNSAAEPPASSTTGADHGLPVRAAFYYPWFPEAWSQQGAHPFTHYQPSLGFYDSTDPSVITTHIRAMEYAGIQAGIASWWGRGSATDQRVPALLHAASTTGFQWALLYESKDHSAQTTTQININLRDIRSHYANHGSYLRVDGRFVVFVYGHATDSCDTVRRWAGARQLGAYVMLKIFSGYERCANQPDGWYQYSPDKGSAFVPGNSFTISPGFWKASEPSPRMSRNLAQWQIDVRDMVASKAPFQLISTFNEWGEGSAVESGSDWSSASGYGGYLDALHDAGNAPKQAALRAATQPAAMNYAVGVLAIVAVVGLLVLGVVFLPRARRP